MPKQYLHIGAQPVLRWTVEVLLAADWIDSISVVVAPDDLRARGVLAGLERVMVLPAGGATRRDTVRNGLLALHGASFDDWILVHDAARPGLTLAALERLRKAVCDDPVGGLLALPVADTVKRAEPDAGGTAPRAGQTVERDGLWLAQTPQVFRKGALLEALERSSTATDEASAIEAAGYRPLLVPGEWENFKITTARDLELMRRLLSSRSA